jgi:sugar transferase (PEP-CTERM/EpsH1 system associated)
VDNLLKKKEIDLVFCFSSTMAEYVFRSSEFHYSGKSTIPLLMDFCDVDSVKWVDYAKIKPWPLSSFFRKEGVLLQQYEQRILKEFSHCFLASSREKALFQKIHDFSDIHVVENGVDLDYFQPTSPETPDVTPPILVLTGAMDYDVNIDGVSWFVHAIWPDIKKYQIDVQFYIVGSNPTQEVLKLADIAGVHVTGYVDDIRSFYNRATICIAPLRIARGIQNKVLEAMAMGKPVICTSNAFEGITAQPDRDLLVYDEPVDFAGQIVTLLAHPERCQQLGRNARLCMERHYSWDSQLSVLDPFLSDTTR